MILACEVPVSHDGHSAWDHSHVHEEQKCHGWRRSDRKNDRICVGHAWQTITVRSRVCVGWWTGFSLPFTPTASLAAISKCFPDTSAVVDLKEHFPRWHAAHPARVY